MIIQRITAVEVYRPNITKVPVGRLTRTIETELIVGSGTRTVSSGDGSITDVSYVDIEVGTYSPKDVIVYGSHTEPARR